MPSMKRILLYKTPRNAIVVKCMNNNGKYLKGALLGLGLFFVLMMTINVTAQTNDTEPSYTVLTDNGTEDIDNGTYYIQWPVSALASYYHIYDNDIMITNTTGHNHTFTITEGGEHNYTIKGYNNDNNLLDIKRCYRGT